MKNIKPVIMIVALFLVLSVTAGVFLTARQTNAPAVDEITDNGILSENNTENNDTKTESYSDDKNDAENDTEKSEATPQPTDKPATEPTAEPTATPAATPQPTPEQPTAVSSDQLRAMWISYLEFQSVDFGSKNAFVSDMTKMFEI